MALDLRHEVAELARTHLDKRLRYRCLVLQTADIGLLSKLSDYATAALRGPALEPRLVHYLDLMDDVGAFSCSRVLEILEQAARGQPVVLRGPLNVLSYWSAKAQAAFWNYLALFTHGPGIVVLDTPREDIGSGPFRLLAWVPGTDVRYLKSRLASTQDGLV